MTRPSLCEDRSVDRGRVGLPLPHCPAGLAVREMLMDHTTKGA